MVRMGDCPLDVSVSDPVEPESYAGMTPGLTAHPRRCSPVSNMLPAGVRWYE